MTKRILLSLVLGAIFASTAAAQVQRPLPVVERIEPTSGPPGTVVTLFGRFFDNAQTVWLSGTELAVDSRLPNRWTVRIPDAAQSGTIEVRTDRGAVNGPRFRVSQALPAPIVQSFVPARGTPGTEVVIHGENFSSRLTENQVHLGALPVVVRQATPNELTVIVPAEAVTGPFRVSVEGSGEAQSAQNFEIGTGVSIASFEPALGPPGTRVTIHGAGFARNRAHNRVTLGTQNARVVTASETELVVELPRNATSGVFNVDVRDVGIAHSATSFDVRLVPTIASFEPASGAPTTRVTVHGAHFGTDVRQVHARIAQTELTVRDIADDHLVVEIPSGAPTGPIEVTVATLAAARSRTPFTVLEPVSVESFVPPNGAVGSVVTIRGRGFDPNVANDTVTIGGHRAEILRASATEIEARVPADATSGPIAVAVPNAGEDRTDQPFVIVRPPTIASFTPNTGGAGTVVTIHGTNFGTRAGLVEVRIGDRRAVVRRVTDTEIDFAIPANATSATLRVTVQLQGTATSTEPFTIAPSS